MFETFRGFSDFMELIAVIFIVIYVAVLVVSMKLLSKKRKESNKK